MNGLLNYLLQMGAVSAIMYGYYHFFLRNKKFHFYNRYYLLAAAMLSILIPFINIPVYFTQETANSNILNTLTILSFGGDETIVTASANKPVLTFTQIIYGIYILVCVALLIRISVSIFRINRLYRDNPVEKLDQIFLIQTNEPGTPFSFFRWLFWNRDIELNSENGQQIFRHELYHIRQKHSLDVFFMEFLTTIIWFNPFFYLMKKELRAIHEFLADQAAVSKNGEWNYAELLLMQVLQTNQKLVNPFFHNQIKRRIAMITSSQKPKHQYIRKMMVLPLVAILTLLFAFTYKEMKEKSDKSNSLTLFDTINDTIPGYKVIPDKVLLNKVKGNDGETFIEFHKTGLKSYTLDSIRFKTIHDKASDPSKKILIVLNGEVMPENFDLDNKQIVAKEAIVYGKDDATAIKKYGPRAKQGVFEFRNAQITKISEPLIVIDGEIQSERGKPVLDKISPEQIQSINVIKDKIAIDKYGSAGVAGVIEIQSKLKDKIVEESITYTIPDTPLFIKSEVEPSFVGGKPGWQKFLERNLNSAIPVEKGAPAGAYTTKVRFIVNVDGKVSDIKAITNHGFGMEEEVIRVIKAGPSWVPAKQNGKTVRAYKEQPVTFVIVDDVEEEVKAVKIAPGKFPPDKSEIVIEEKEIKEQSQLGEVVVMGYPTKKEPIELKLIPTENKPFDKEGSIYPNPATNMINVPISSSIVGKAVIKITTTKGEVVLTQNYDLQKGLNTVKINTSSLAKGAYLVNVALPDKGVRTYKMIKE